MTSKDIVERIRQFANPYGNGYPYNQYTDSYGKLCEELNVIEKDLEILEIIKSGLYNAEIINDWLCGVLSVKLNNEQKIIVKEWLEHETKRSN